MRSRRTRFGKSDTIPPQPRMLDRRYGMKLQLPLGRFTFLVETEGGGKAQRGFEMTSLAEDQPAVVLQAKQGLLRALPDADGARAPRREQPPIGQERDGPDAVSLFGRPPSDTGSRRPIPQMEMDVEDTGRDRPAIG